MSSVSEIRERFVGATDMGREAFEELANYTAALEAEKEEKAEMARWGIWIFSSQLFNLFFLFPL